jgi:hypothetical protein
MDARGARERVGVPTSTVALAVEPGDVGRDDQETGRDIAVADADDAVVRHFCGVFQREATNAVPATA